MKRVTVKVINSVVDQQIKEDWEYALKLQENEIQNTTFDIVNTTTLDGIISSTTLDGSIPNDITSSSSVNVNESDEIDIENSRQLQSDVDVEILYNSDDSCDKDDVDLDDGKELKEENHLSFDNGKELKEENHLSFDNGKELKEENPLSFDNGKELKENVDLDDAKMASDELVKEDKVPVKDDILASIDGDDESEVSKLIDSSKYDPNTEYKIIKDQIQPFEREFSPEWFLFQSRKQINKTPSRYMKIRNHIIDLWEEHQCYISKSRIRPGLKGEGDVNAISRIHSVLENIKAINYGIVKSNPKRLKHDVHEDDITETQNNNQELDPDLVSQLLGKRKRKQRHLTNLESNSLSRPRKPKPNPFKLINPKSYTQPPFTVSINVKVQMTIDFHSHLAHSEIIGLLGGYYSPTTHTLHITSIYPCKSICNTTKECELDPESELFARHFFNENSVQSVGWYHSHPTFASIPSRRDIETQETYQNLFGEREFVGIIASPYDFNTPVYQSRVSVWHVSGGEAFHLPFVYSSGTWSGFEVFSLAVESVSGLSSRVGLEEVFDGEYVCLKKREKVVKMLEGYLALMDFGVKKSREYVEQIMKLLE